MRRIVPTLPSWYGYQRWGLLDYFLEQPGRYTLTEAFFANQAALVHRLQTCFPDVANEASDSPTGRILRPVAPGPAAKAAGLTAQDAAGLLFDRDVAIYCDPAWSARMAPGALESLDVLPELLCENKLTHQIPRAALASSAER
jgi:zinc protease